MAQLGIPIRDAEFFDIETYFEVIDIHSKMIKGNNTPKPRKATQAEIDLFLL